MPTAGGSDAKTFMCQGSGSGSSNVKDLTGGFKGCSGVFKIYKHPAEQDLAKFAMTMFANKYATLACDSRNMANSPSTHTIKTGVTSSTTVYRDITASVSFGGRQSGGAVHGFVQAIQLDEVYRVCFAAEDNESVGMIEARYNALLEGHNFFQGQSLRYSGEGVEFIPTPATVMADAILPAETLKEYDLNVIQFLTREDLQAITKKRGIILHGPPGTGKTTSVKAMFHVLKDAGVTCVYISDASFIRHSVEEVFSFINTYLAPCLVVFEDIDLIAADRRTNSSRIIGPLLSAMNGIEETSKPLVILATTNRPEILDAAVTRPCRFDRKILIDYPTTEELNRLFRKIAGFAAPKDLLVQPAAADKKLTGAHVEELYRTAALTARQTKRSTKECVVEALETVQRHFMLVSPRTVQGFQDDQEEAGLDDRPRALRPQAPDQFR